MNFAEIKAALRGLINRSDMTDDLAKQFIRRTQIRLERQLHTAFMQKYVSFEVNNDEGRFRVPVDYLEMIELYTNHGQIEQVDTSYWLTQNAGPGIPVCYIQTGHEIRMRPAPAQTDTIYFRYFGCEPELYADTQTNQWTICSPDALIYGAAELAADHYEDERLERFTSRFQTCLTELLDHQQQEDFSGPIRVQPAYRFPPDY